MYYWKVPSTIRFRGACHAVELAYVFGNLDETIYTGRKGKKSIAEVVQRMWVNFAKTGNPSTVPYRWPKYGRQYRATMIIDSNIHVEMSPRDKSRRMLLPLLDEHINMSYAEMSYNVPFVRGVATAGALTLAAIGTAVVRVLKK
jgi:para-nitrobenzyl esterase